MSLPGRSFRNQTSHVPAQTGGYAIFGRETGRLWDWNAGGAWCVEAVLNFF